MDVQNSINQAKDLVSSANDIVIVIHERPTPDSVGSSLAAYLGLISLGKKVTLVCPDPMTVGLSGFIGANKFIQQLGQKNFIISLDYTEGSIEKVSYNIEGNKFNLVIEPRVGYDSFSEDKVHFTQIGANADLIIAFDTIHLGSLKKLFEDNKELFANKPIINVDRHPNNSLYGQVNIVDATASSTSELTLKVLTGIGVQLAPDIATNILNALYAATNNFLLPNIAPSAFETAAICVKHGAKRFYMPPPMPIASPEERPTIGEGVNRAAQMPFIPASQQVPVAQQAPVSQQPQVPAQEKNTTPPSDWLKPKIFKSSTSS